MAALGLAFNAGILSVLSPCVLPLLPLVRSAATSEHRLGPAALASGLAVSFVAIGLFVATVGFAVGLDTDIFRTVAAILLVLIGLVLMVPAAQTRLAVAAGPVSGWTENRFGGFSTVGLRVTAGREVGEAGPGDLLVLDLSRPVRIEMQAMSGVGLVLPRRLVAVHGDDLRQWHGRILSGSGDPVVLMVADYLCHLARCVAAGSPDLIRHLTSATSILCKALVSVTDEADATDRRPARGIAIGPAMRGFIEDHLADVDVRC